MEDYLRVVDQINQKFEQFKLLVTQEKEVTKQLERFPLTPQQEMMMGYIIRHQPVTANEIANFLGITKSAVSQVIPKLEEKELIKRQTNPNNRRETLIDLGKRGQEYLQLLEDIDRLLVQKYYSRATLDELRQILGTLTKIVGRHAINNEEGP